MYQKKRILKTNHLLMLVFLFSMMTVFTFFATSKMQKTSALTTTAGFNPGNIISDARMSDYQSMTVDEIQQFLNEKGKCTNTNYALYQEQSSRYPSISWHFENGHFICLSEERFGEGQEIGSGQTAAEIIYEVAQEYQINPQVLIVLLEKEQGLITDTFPNSRQYRSATGYGCPDTAACDSKYYGFKNQLKQAAYLFRYTLDNGYYAYPEQVSGVRVRFSPNASCGSSEVLIENRATAALYRYTPYQPNAAALNANWGTGDNCSAYGNRNFYLFFTEWFGSTQVSVAGTVVTPPNGIYYLTNITDKDQILEIAGSDNRNGANAQTWRRQNSGSRGLQITRVGDSEYYQINDVLSGKAYDLSAADIKVGANIQLWDSNGSCAQQWKIYQTDRGEFSLESACKSGMVIALDRKADNGANVQLAVSGNSNTQYWMLNTYQLKEGEYIVSSALNRGYVVDLDGNNQKPETNIQLYTNNDTVAQKWTFKYDSVNDAYTILSSSSGKAIDVSGGVMASSVNIQSYNNNGTCAQQWKLVPISDERYAFISLCNYSYVLDLSGANVNSGANIQLYHSNNTSAQYWTLKEIGRIEEGDYSINLAADQNLAIDVQSGSTLAGANVWLYSKNGTAAQRWNIKYDNSKKGYVIRNPRSGNVLRTQTGGVVSETNLIVGAEDGMCSQYWQINQLRENQYYIISLCNGDIAVDVSGGARVSSTNLWAYSLNHTDAQIWTFNKI